jgi:3-hydroxybutyryl-CoA dehydrogenase
VALEKAKNALLTSMQKLVDKGKISKENADKIIHSTAFSANLNDLTGCDLVIEAIVENLDVKKSLFSTLDALLPEAVLASNTSSLSIASIASACKNPARVIGLHFFNPATLMPLVEIIPAVQTKSGLAADMYRLMADWGKTPVIVKDTPGFIVNRVARPFYGEALRIYEEGLADKAEIDQAMKTAGFRMGPFELMDFIGNDVNYAVTESVFAAFYFDARYSPSLIQKRLVEAGWLGRKSGKGHYDYQNPESTPVTDLDSDLGDAILQRILAMLINEAANALYLNIASRDDIDLAMTRGVNYPKGLLAWCDEKGTSHWLNVLDNLFEEYREERYRCSPLLRRMAKSDMRFY